MVSRRRFLGDMAALSVSGLALKQRTLAEKFEVSPHGQSAQQGVLFKPRFAPSEGMVCDLEKPLRDELCLNGSWRFQPIAVPKEFRRGTGVPPELPLPVESKWDVTPLKVPSPWNVNTWGNGRGAGDGTRQPYVADSVYYPSYPRAWDAAEMGWLQRTFLLPPSWKSRSLILHFEAVAGDAQVFLNGRLVTRHFDSFMPFEADVTELVESDRENILLVGIRKSNLLNIITPGYPEGQQRTYPNGSNMDNLVGIWNDVYLWALPSVRIDGVFVQPQVAERNLRVEVVLRNDTDIMQHVTVSGEVSPWKNLAGTDVLSAPEPKWKLDAPVLDLRTATVSVPAKGNATLTLECPVKGELKTWAPDHPNLNGLVLHVKDRNQQKLDTKYTRFGWRQFTLKGRKLVLNGEPLKLWGDFGHPFGPFVLSRRYVWQDYTMIKSMGGNMVRPHANVMPRFWLELADEMGLCVLDETSIFGSSIALNLKEPITWERFTSHLDGLVIRDRNHPSVFGWGVANEMFALSLHTDKADHNAGYALLKQLAERPRRLDPTRQWISVDGDQDLDGSLPVWSKHMGIGLPKDLPNLDKPRMIGEHGGTYFAGPPLLRSINGDKAYESYRGRNEALAYDLYRMVTQTAIPDLTAFSESEIVWFGIEQLPFGYTSVSRPPNKTDGIFFPVFVENVPGVQIERLPPYVMGLNPGFDPELPAFRPLPLYEAMKAAINPLGPQESPWSRFPILSRSTRPNAPAPVEKVAYLGAPDSELSRSLSAMGVPLIPLGDGADIRILVIDGETVNDSQAQAATVRVTDLLDRNGLVWVMVPEKGAALNNLKSILGQDVSLTNREATSLVHGRANSSVDSLTLADLYFANETGDRRIQKAGLAGSFVDAGRVLLTACNSDWTLFEHCPETAKCGSMLIYEHLQKPAGAALVEANRSKGKVWLSTLNPAPTSPAFLFFWSQLWSQVGVHLDQEAKPTPQKKQDHDLLLDGPP